jgi:hypothetical protein
MVGLLDPEESQGFLLITNQARSGVIPVAYAASQKDTSYLFRNVKTQVKPVINNNIEKAAITPNIPKKAAAIMNKKRNKRMLLTRLTEGKV